MTIQNNIAYREGSIKDKEQLKKLGIVSYAQFSNILTPDNWATLNTFLHDENKLLDLINKSKIYVALDQDEIIGMAYIIPNGNPWDIFKGEWSYIRMLGVNPEYQGQGVAKTLIKMCINQAKQTNEETIALHTSEFMNAARHIYEGLGFRILREVEPRFGKKYWLYTLDLNDALSK
jgi:ribosomal protein S18 acetylase RimI-like enzyme